MFNSRSAIRTSIIAGLLCATSAAQITRRESISTSGNQGNAYTAVGHPAALSADGRFVVFSSDASTFVPGDTNSTTDTFVRDRNLGTTERVSLSSAGVQGNNMAGFTSISANGNFVAFDSLATNLVSGDTNGAQDTFVRDRLNQTTERVNVDSGGAQGNGPSYFGSPSEDGRYVVFMSYATNLVAGDTNGVEDIFLRDRQLGTTERISIDSGGAQANGPSTWWPVISADGRFVAFESSASNLVAGDTNGVADVFIRDRQAGTTEIVSVDSGGGLGDDSSSNPSITPDGRFVAFNSWATNLVANDTNGYQDIFVRDRQSGTTDLVSRDSGGALGDSSSVKPSISADGTLVAFESDATNLVPGDSNAGADIFVRDLLSGTTVRVSITTAGVQNIQGSYYASLSADGRVVAFETGGQLVPQDTNSWNDAYIRDLEGLSFTSLCDPGVGGVQTCPCGNAPSGSGRGCNNSASTGGAILAASGATYLTSDSLVFTTSGEKPTATSVLLQGPSSPAAGIIYGQGIRCVGGATKRLFTKSAVAGSITVPNFGAGDPTVSARSAAKGDVIAPGQTRWYLVFYRDPIVLGGCPVTSTFNATQTGRVVWIP